MHDIIIFALGFVIGVFCFLAALALAESIDRGDDNNDLLC